MVFILQFVIATASAVAASAAPEVNTVEPFVWRVDATNQVTLKGKELAGFRGLWTSRHGVLAADSLTPAVEDEGNLLKLTATLDARTAPGPFALRVITDTGTSEPVMAMLELLPELTPDQDGLLAGVGYVNSALKEAAGDQYRVVLKKGEAFAVEVCAGQFGSKLDPVLRITDLEGRELAFVQDSPGMGVDCLTQFNAPATGEYLIAIRDAGYGSGRDYHYQLRLGPSAGGGSTARVHGSLNFDLVRSSGRVAGSHPEIDAFFQQFTTSVLTSKPLAMAMLSGTMTGAHPSAAGRYGLIPVATYPVAELHPLSGHANELNRPYSLNGEFQRPGERLQIRLKMKEPSTWRLAAMSRRLGGEADPAMRILTDEDKSVAESHLFNNESVLKWECRNPGDYVLEIWDAAGQYGPQTAFHIQAQENPAEFELNTETDSLRITAGGEAELTVTINRDGYDGPVKFALTHGPEGVELADHIAKEKTKEAKFKVKLADTLEPGSTFPIKICGRRGEAEDAPRAPLYTSAYWKKHFPDLYSPMFEFEDTVWVTVVGP